ncbi:Glycosyltransferase AglJ [uncultured archaeon]|nr:Glycosyltransferase AglJ [uncultured archaeon]
MPKGKLLASGKLVSIVIPALNEERNMGPVLSGVKRQMSGYNYELIVVDGHSRDRTADVARRMGAKVMYDELGKGSALIRGLGAAKGEILVSMDADLSNEPRELKLLIDAIDIGYDLCTGSRFLMGGGSEDISSLRVFGNKFFVFMVNSLFSANYTDLCYGYRSFRKSAFAKLDLEEVGFGIETEINIKAVKKGLKIIEIPSTEKKRAAGEGKLTTFGDGFVILKTIIRNLF